jgi:cyclic pyranopterin phosphate synthase
LRNAVEPERRQEGKGAGLMLVMRQDLDDAERDKRPECRQCRYHGACEGVWRNYLKRYGWDEFVPVAAAAAGDSAVTAAGTGEFRPKR